MYVLSSRSETLNIRGVGIENWSGFGQTRQQHVKPFIEEALQL